MTHRLATDECTEVSVIVPNFNHGQHLTRSIEALASQDCPPGEIIVIDDASTDDSVVIVERLATRFPSIRLFRNPDNLGVTRTVLKGIAASSGRYLAFAAADDWVMPGFFSLAVAMLERYPQAGLFCGDMALIDGVSGRRLGLRPAVVPRFTPGYVSPAQMRQKLVYGDYQIVTGGALFRRDAFVEAGGLDEELGSFSDGFLACKIALTRGFCYAPEVVATWRLLPTGLSRDTALNLDKARRMLEVAHRKLASDPAFPNWYPDQFSKRWRFATSRLVLNERRIDFNFVTAMSARNGFDRAVLGAIAVMSKGSFGRLAALSWLWFRLRPYRLRDLVSTWVFRCIPFRSPAIKPALENGNAMLSL